jgi:DUF438 domain-containing protein
MDCITVMIRAGPSKVMWGKDDEVLEFLKAMGDALAVGEATGRSFGELSFSSHPQKHR